MVCHLVPFYGVTRAVRAEYRVAGIQQIGVGVIAYPLDDLLGVVARLITAESQRDFSRAARISYQLGGIVLHFGHGSRSAEEADVSVLNGLRKASAHALNVVHSLAEVFGGKLDSEVVNRLKQYALCAAQALSDSAVGGLSEISALGVLWVRLARNEGDLHIGYRGARQHPNMSFFVQVSQNKPLPVLFGQILLAGGVENESAVAFCGLQQQMDLGVVAQRLKMPNALDGVFDRFLVDYVAHAEADLKAEPLRNNSLQHLKLYLAHQPELNTAVAFVPRDVQHWVLRFKNAHFFKRRPRAYAVGQL